MPQHHMMPGSPAYQCAVSVLDTPLPTRCTVSTLDTPNLVYAVSTLATASLVYALCPRWTPSNLVYALCPPWTLPPNQVSVPVLDSISTHHHFPRVKKTKQNKAKTGDLTPVSGPGPTCPAPSSAHGPPVPESGVQDPGFVQDKQATEGRQHHLWRERCQSQNIIFNKSCLPREDLNTPGTLKEISGPVLFNKSSAQLHNHSS